MRKIDLRLLSDMSQTESDKNNVKLKLNKAYCLKFPVKTIIQLLFAQLEF